MLFQSYILGVLKVAKVEVDPVPCTIVNMDFFKKLFRQGELLLIVLQDKLSSRITAISVRKKLLYIMQYA